MRKLILAVLLFCASLAAHAQGSTLPFARATDQNGNGLRFAALTFCSLPTTINTLGTCQTPITVYQDQATNIPYGSAIQTDGVGNFPPNLNTLTSLWFTPGTYCYTLTVSNMQSPATNPCTPFTVPIVPGSSPTFAGITLTGNESLSSASVICWNSDSGITRAAAKSFKMGDCAGSSDGSLALGNLTIANTLNVNNIKQQAGASFALLDPLGVSHLFISSSSPYTNLFLSGNGTGSVLLGSAGKTSVADTTGNIVTAGTMSLQTTAQTLPATFANDTLGGLLFTTNAGKGWQIANSNGQLQSFAGVGILLQGATSGGINFVVPAIAGSNTLTFPAATDTLVAKATTDTLTNKTLTSPVITNPTINSGVTAGSGLKHQRFGATTATAAAAGSTALTAYTWASAFADANYTITCTGITQANTPNGVTVESITASGFSVRVTAITAAAASFAGVDCIAIHD